VDLLFKEEQRFDQWWLWLILIGVVGVCFIPLFYVEKDSIPLTVVVLAAAVPILLILLFLVMKLTTKIYSDRIEMKFSPFVSSTYHIKCITSAEVKDYGFVGGWGIRLWPGYYVIYNVRGKMGLEFESNGKKRIIGTQRPEEMKTALKKTQLNGQHNR
jgi:hypothetical protein